ncbi:DUF6704 family protein [Leucobacter sp. M11]|uniref:DUF6704 family protein n=1 Tax=Leucobacter sp. M11 TaxID=2993565 RepID=UPI002D7F7BD6|nr:DUF6704 family protein [Leucobacter sp. M11]MEB4616264.1 hypothetical protein [Leucobacter sp. M11]
MTTQHEEPGHGDSPAAWTAVVVMLIAVTIGTVAFFLNMPWLVWASAGLLLLGLIVGWVMAKAGYGVRGPKFVPKKTH